MKSKLLLIDDDKLFLMLNKQQVINSDFHDSPETFLNAALALEWLNQNDHPNERILLFLDINMPDMNGWQLLEMLSQNTYQANILVVMVSSSTDPDDIAKASSFKQVIAYLAKPLKAPDLLALKANSVLENFF